MAMYEGGTATIRKLIKAVGLNPDDGYSRVVIECSVGSVARVYATKHMMADEVLRVAETLEGPAVLVQPGSDVEMVVLNNGR